MEKFGSILSSLGWIVHGYLWAWIHVDGALLQRRFFEGGFECSISPFVPFWGQKESLSW